MILGNCFDRKIEAFFREGNFDVIHVHHPVLVGQTALYLGKKYKIPGAYTYHTRYEEYLHHFKLYEAMASGEYPVSRIARYGKEILVPSFITAFPNQCDLVFAPTSTMKDHLLEQGTKTRISVLPTGLDRVSFQYDEMLSAEIRNMYRERVSVPFCHHAPGEGKEPGFSFFRVLHVLGSILGQDFRLMVIGDGTERRHLEELAGMLGISRQIVFTRKIENTWVRHYLNAADAFLFASKSETQGIVLLEAMAAGCPVAAVRASGVVDVVRQGINGYMTEEAPGGFCCRCEPGWYWNGMSGQECRRRPVRQQNCMNPDGLQLWQQNEYGLMTGQKEDAGYGEHGKGMFVPSILRLFKAA
ncbi:MAG: glycosyltransferase [Enterocloster sp.]